MTSAWRICKERFAATAFDGDGARIHGGRWNERGTAMVYCASTASLAALELLVHVDVDQLPDDLVLIEARIPDGVSRQVLDVAKLPVNWRRSPGPDALKALGARWAAGLRTALLGVPSAVLPSERCLLVNPGHADSRRLLIQPAVPFALDPRLRR